MKQKFKLSEMLEEIKRDDALEKNTSEILSRDEIQKMVAARRYKTKQVKQES